MIFQPEFLKPGHKMAWYLFMADVRSSPGPVFTLSAGTSLIDTILEVSVLTTDNYLLMLLLATV
jgi:hypothetical protein